MLVGVLLIALLEILVSEAARILVVVPSPSISHQVVFRPLTQELASRGHEVTLLTTDPSFPKGQAPKNLIEIDLHNLSYTKWRETDFQSTTGKTSNLRTQFEIILTEMSKIFELQMLTDEVQELLAKGSDYFDVLLLEAYMRPAIGLSHVFKAPVILISSFGGMITNYDVVGAPARPVLLYPTLYRQRIYNLSFWEKLVELYNHYYMEHLFETVEQSDDKLIKRLFGPNTPTIRELENNVQMLFLNLHPIWESNRPVPPNVVYMGGLHQKTSKELPEDLKSYLDTSKNGVIYISFGTNVSPSVLPPERIQVMVGVLSQLPYDVLWKWDKDELPGKTENIRISKWLPQSDLLKHPKVKLFITQGGLQSTDEAITAGVPLIGMPMLGDQWYNVEQYVHHQIGIRLDLETLTEEKFLSGVKTVVENDRFRQNIQKLRLKMNDQPQKPLERTVWWVEHLLRHAGASHLKARTANLSWSEYLDLDFHIKLALSALVIMLALYSTARLLFKVRSYAFSNGVTGKLKKG